MLVNRDELALSDWMAQTLHLTWAEHPEPWTVEAGAIAELGAAAEPAENRSHPMRQFVAEARKRWREEARSEGR